jgi:tetratricopeptide (TPR) repeat protein
MSRGIWIHRSSVKLSRRIGWRMAAILAFGLLLVAWMREPRAAAGSDLVSAPAQERDPLAAQRKFEEGNALRNQGTAESLRLALKKYEEALLLWRAIGNPDWEATTLTNIGVVYYSLGERREALDFYNQALPLHRAVGNRRDEAITLNNIGMVYNSLGERRKALDFYNQALPLHRAVDNRREEAITLYNIGDVYYAMSERRKALDFYNQALPLRRAVGDRNGEARTLTSIGLMYHSLGEERKALDFYDQALTLKREVGDRVGEAGALNNIGQVYNSLGEKQKALDFYDQARALWRAIGYRRGEAKALYNIGDVYGSLGEKQKALDFYNQALSLRRAAGDRRGEAETLNNIGQVYYLLGEIQKALDFYNQALSLYRAVGDRNGEAESLNGIGAVYSLLGEKQKALDLYSQALALFREIGGREEEANMLSNIGQVYDSLGEEQKALDFFTESLSLLRETGDREGEDGALNGIGQVYDSLGERQKALDFFAQALSLRHAIGDRQGEAGTLNNIGLVYDSLGERQKALEFFTQALSHSRAVGDRDGEATTLYNIALVKRVLGRYDESRSHIESALKIIESLRAEVVSKELRASYLATVAGYYKFYIDLLMWMRKQEPTNGHGATAFETSERARARSLLESLAEARADIRRGVDPKLIEQERSLQQRLSAKAEEALKLSATAQDEARLATLRQEMDALTVEIQQAQARIRQTSPSYAALTQPQPLTLAEIQRQALDADTLLLEYSLGEERSFLWAVTPTTIDSYELPKREVIEAAAKRVYALLSNAPGVRGRKAKPRDLRLEEADGQYLAAAASLSRTLLGPVAGQLGRKRLLIVADGALHYIPFGALPDPNSLKEGEGIWQPLIVEHDIVNLPSASTIAVLRRELAGRKPAPKTLAVLADPVFSKDDERVKPGAHAAAMQTSPPNPLNEALLRKLAQVAGAASMPDDLRVNRLPYTRLEAEQIMALVPAGEGMKALDFEASLATATSAQLSQYRYVHFATHGLADSERPELSALVLSLYDEQGRPQDGFLRANDVYNLELPAELVTLSACETGLGKLTKGEGLVSLTRGFMYAGAARVVVSLWSVNDRATAELMGKFYRRILVNGERPAAALRAAQVEMWRDKRWESPYYWAAFTLQGEWR